MNGPRTAEETGRTAGDDLRRRLLAGAPVTERRLDLAGVSTAVLEGGDGPPVVLLHGQGGWAGVWVPVMADLVRDHRVVAPDLPGLGASRVDGAAPTADRVLALVRHSLRPSERTAMGMLRQVSADVDRVKRRMGDRWDPFRAYSLELARTPSVRRANRQLLRELGLRQLPPEEVSRIDVPTTLIWGRQDRVMPLATAREASVRYGWPLDVVDDAGHFLGVDQPEAFLQALRRALDQG